MKPRRRFTLPFKIEVASLIDLLKSHPSLDDVNDQDSSPNYYKSSLFLGALQPTPTELGQLLKLRSVRTLGGEALTDEHCEVLGKCQSLEYLDLSDSQVTDVGIAKIASITELQKLDLRGTRVTAAGEHRRS